MVIVWATLLGLDWQIQAIPAGFANPAGADEMFMAETVTNALFAIQGHFFDS